MKEVTEVINKTPFKNNTYKFFATGAKDDHPGVFYTPYKITNWFFDAKPRSWDSINMCIHDICHVIDLYQEGQEHRLLLPDFGWKLQDYGEKNLPAKCFIRELRVITMQNFLRARIFNVQGNPNDDYLKRDFRSRTYEPLLPGREWRKTTDRMTAEHEQFGVVNYLKLWKQACKYVKHNRN